MPIEPGEKQLREKYGLDQSGGGGVSYSSVGMEFAMTFLVCGAIGYGLDYLLGTSPWLILVGFLIGIVGGMVRLVRNVSKIK